ncbi:MAG: PIN domain-containing protein [Gemmatimonadota bacterium]|nr:PIN domain-containing protein [Gemmatimonadota bacterium]
MRDALAERIASAHLIHIDARVFAFHLLAEPTMIEATRAVMGALRDGLVRGQTSALTLYQILAELYRRGEQDRAAELGRDLMVHNGLEIVPVTTEIAIQAAEVRAQLGGRPERAVQIATALVERADLFLTTDSALRRIAGMSVLNLEG